MRRGRLNLITDVAGLQVGNAGDAILKSGVTVLTSPTGFRAAVDVMGGAPGTRETDCLAPDCLVDRVDALVLAGGSAFGLDAASGVVETLRHQGRGFRVGPVSVPIVPAAILFDLLNGGDKHWQANPYAELGRQACLAADDTFALGTAGAGIGATTARLKGGLGSASVVLDNGHTVGALVAANPNGSPVVPAGGHFWAAPFEVDGEFGGLGYPSAAWPLEEPKNEKLTAYQARANTTIAIVATDAALDKSQLRRMAVAAQDGMARALVPAHTPFDGDLVFALSTDSRPLQAAPVDLLGIGNAAAHCLSRAIARAVYLAHAEAGDILPTWQQLYGEATAAG